MASSSAVPTASSNFGATGCDDPTCDASRINATDLYCEHDRFLPTVRWTTAGRLTFALAWRAAVCAAFLATVTLGSPLPVYVAAATLGAALVGLPLRRFPLAGPAAVAAWVALCAIVPISLASSHANNRTIVTVVLAATLAAWMVSFARFAFALDADNDRLAGATLISALAFAVSCAIIVALPQLPYGRDIFVVPEAVITPLTTIGVIAVVGAVVAALLGGLMRAADSDAPGQPRGLPSPARPRPMARPRRRRRPARPASALDLGALVLRMLARFVDEVGFAARLLGLSMVHALRWLLYGVVIALVSIFNAIWRWLIQALRVAWEGLKLLPPTLRRSARVVGIPFAGLTVAAWLAYRFAERDLTYLDTGSIRSLVGLLAYSAGATLALTVAWIALSEQRVPLAIRSAAVTLSTSAAAVLVLTAIGGWVVGLFGTFGYGPISVGWVTIGATAILVLSAVWSALRNRRGDRSTDVAPPNTIEPRATVAAQQ